MRTWLQSTQHRPLRGMFLKFWSLRDIFVTSSATFLKIVPNKYIFYVFILVWQSTSELREVGALLNRFKASSKIFYWPFQGGTSFVDFLCFFCHMFVMPLYASVYLCLWSPAGKGLSSWLSFVVSYCKCVTFQLVYCVRCGTWLYRFLIFAPFLRYVTWMGDCKSTPKQSYSQCTDA